MTGTPGPGGVRSWIADRGAPPLVGNERVGGVADAGHRRLGEPALGLDEAQGVGAAQPGDDRRGTRPRQAPEAQGRRHQDGAGAHQDDPFGADGARTELDEEGEARVAAGGRRQGRCGEGDGERDGRDDADAHGSSMEMATGEAATVRSERDAGV